MIKKNHSKTPKYPPVLIVDDDDYILDSFSAFLRQGNWNVSCAKSADEALQKIKKEHVELVITDISMPAMDGLSLLKRIKEINPEIEVILMTGYSNEESAIQALKAGAFDYFRKPIKGNEVIASLSRTKHVLELKFQNKRLKALLSHLAEKDNKHPFVGDSEAAIFIIRQLKKIAVLSNATVLISGETGVGKEVAARMLHQLSKPKDSPYVAANCGGISESLLMRELFGHERGAFTGAENRSPGFFEMSLGGTLLLDEISELSLSAQSSLLRVMDERSFRRVGGSYEISLGNTGITLCTNKDLKKMVMENNFREDLFFRLNVLHITIPPLRERKEDILSLANYFLQSLGLSSSLSLSPKAEKSLEDYDYPGNIRELKNIIQYAAIFRSGNVIFPSDLSFAEFSPKQNLEVPSQSSINSSAANLNLKKNEIALIYRALTASSYNYSLAARTLGITAQALHRRLEKYNIT